MRKRVVARSRDRCGRATSCASRRGADRSRSPGQSPSHCSPNLTPMSRLEPVPEFDLAADAYRRRIRIAHRCAGRGRLRARGRLPPLRRHAHATTARSVVTVAAESRRWPWSHVPGRGRAAARARGHAPLAAVHRRGSVDRPEAELHAPVRRRVPRDHARRVGSRRARSTTWKCRGASRRPARPRCASGSTASCALAWSLTWYGIVDPEPPLTRAPWRGGFMRWADATLPKPRRRVRDRAPARRRHRRWDAGWISMRVPVASELPPVDGRRVLHDAAGHRRGRDPQRGHDPRLRGRARTAAVAAVLTRRPGLGGSRGQLEVDTDTTGVAGGVEPNEPTNG